MRVKVRTIYKAIEKNGMPWARNGRYFDNNGAYCAIGQASVNLKVSPGSVHRALNNLKDDEGVSLGNEIAAYNDYSAHSYEDVVEYAKEVLTPHFNKIVTIHEEF